jgi:hypothetical protein
MHSLLHLLLACTGTDKDAVDTGGEAALEVNLADTMVVSAGAEAGGWVGSSLAGGIDLLGDGATHLAMGAPGAGEVHLIASTASSLAGATTLSGDQIGSSLSLVTGATPGLLIGAVANETVHLLLTPITAGSLDATTSVATFTSTAGEGFGGALASGVLTGGSDNDTIIGARDGSAVYIFDTAVGTVDTTSAVATVLGTDDRTGSSLVVLDDINGDGMADLLSGAPGATHDGATTGAIHVFFGPLTGTYAVGDADITLWGEADDDAAGTSLTSLGDLDGDGLSDMLIGAPGHPPDTHAEGVLFLIHGQNSYPDSVLPYVATARIHGEDDWDTFAAIGTTVASAGDVDGDGTGDLVATAPATEGSMLARIYVLSGALEGNVYLTTSENIMATIQSDSPLDGAGQALLNLPETGGTPRLYIGAPHSSQVDEDAGAVFKVRALEL